MTSKRSSTISWYFTQTLQNRSDSFSKVLSNFAVVTLFCAFCLSTCGEGPRLPKSHNSTQWVGQNIFVKMLKNETLSPLLTALFQLLP